MTMDVLFASAAGNPDPQFFANFWNVVAFLAAIAVNVVTLVKVTRSQKREVSFTFTPASKEEFDRHVARNDLEHRELFSKLSGMESAMVQKLQELDGKNEDRIRRLHSRVDDVVKAVCRVEGRIEARILKDHEG